MAPLTLREYATAEATRLMARAKATDGQACRECIQTAARRAPGIKAGAEALHQLTITGSDEIKSTIPSDVKAFVVESAVASTDANIVERIGAWLKAAPWELQVQRCNAALAALAAVAPVADVRTQDKKNRNIELEEEVAAHRLKKRRRFESSTHGPHPAKRPALMCHE